MRSILLRKIWWTGPELFLFTAFASLLEDYALQSGPRHVSKAAQDAGNLAGIVPLLCARIDADMHPV